MKTIIRLLYVALFIIWSGAVSAGPITYQFNMPAFLTGPFAGQTSILDVTVDNGSMSTANQSYLNTEITAMMVDIVGTIFGVPVDTVVGSLAYITTDASSIPTLDLSENMNTATVAKDGAYFIQLGTRDDSAASGPNQYAVGTPDPNKGVSAIADDIVVVGSIANQVSAPATLTLFGLGLAGLGWLRRKKS